MILDCKILEDDLFFHTYDILLALYDSLYSDDVFAVEVWANLSCVDMSLQIRIFDRFFSWRL